MTLCEPGATHVAGEEARMEGGFLAVRGGAVRVTRTLTARNKILLSLQISNLRWEGLKKKKKKIPLDSLIFPKYHLSGPSWISPQGLPISSSAPMSLAGNFPARPSTCPAHEPSLCLEQDAPNDKDQSRPCK